jgi:homoserine kinase
MHPSLRTTSACAFAPGSIGNLGPGFDVLGLAFTGRGDEVTAQYTEQQGIRIIDPGHPDLPYDATRHTAGIAATEVLKIANVIDVGVELTVKKGLPLCGGQGGSAASSVAAAVAVNAMLADPLTPKELLQACLAAEATVAGRHLDNIAASLLGGGILVRSIDEYDIVTFPVPTDLHLVLVHPHQLVATYEGRSVLPKAIPRDISIMQTAHATALLIGLMLGDYDIIRRSLTDHIAEPVRAPFIQGFSAAKNAALEAGAYGCSISGSGPTTFAFVRSIDHGEKVGEAMQREFRAHGVESDIFVTVVDSTGARIVSEGECCL